jgi:hypothetical protein
MAPQLQLAVWVSGMVSSSLDRVRLRPYGTNIMVVQGAERVTVRQDVLRPVINAGPSEFRHTCYSHRLDILPNCIV